MQVMQNQDVGLQISRSTARHRHKVTTGKTGNQFGKLSSGGVRVELSLCRGWGGGGAY